MNASTPGFCRPIEFSIPLGGLGDARDSLPAHGSSDDALGDDARRAATGRRSRRTRGPSAKVPDAVITGLRRSSGADRGRVSVDAVSAVSAGSSDGIPDHLLGVEDRAVAARALAARAWSSTTQRQARADAARHEPLERDLARHAGRGALRRDDARHRLGTAHVHDVRAVGGDERPRRAPSRSRARPREPSSVASSSSRARRARRRRARAAARRSARRARPSPPRRAPRAPRRASPSGAAPRPPATSSACAAPSGMRQAVPERADDVHLVARAASRRARASLGRAPGRGSRMPSRVRAVHRERAPQDEVGAVGDAQVDELPRRDALARCAGRAASSRPTPGARRSLATTRHAARASACLASPRRTSASSLDAAAPTRRSPAARVTPSRSLLDRLDGLRPTPARPRSS